MKEERQSQFIKLNETDPTPPRSSHGPYGELVKSYRFRGFSAGQKVNLDGSFLADRVQWATDWRWDIIAFTTNVLTGKQWVELWGGSAKWAHVFAAPIEALIKVDNRRR